MSFHLIPLSNTNITSYSSKLPSFTFLDNSITLFIAFITVCSVIKTGYSILIGIIHILLIQTRRFTFHIFLIILFYVAFACFGAFVCFRFQPLILISANFSFSHIHVGINCGDFSYQEFRINERELGFDC